MRLVKMNMTLVKGPVAVENETTNCSKRLSVPYIFVMQMLLGYASILVPHVHSILSESDVLSRFDECEIHLYHKSGTYHIFCPEKENHDFSIVLNDMKIELELQCKIPNKFQLNIIPDLDFDIEFQSLKVCNCRLFGFDEISAKFDMTNLKELKIKNVVLENESLSLLDAVLFGNIPSIESLEISNISKSFSENSFQNLSNLKYLTLVNNKIRELGYLFENNEELKVLDLSKNHLKSLAAGVFKKLSSLQQLCLNTNELSMIRNNYFIGLSHLESLDLSTNFISHLEENSFSNLNDLIGVNLKSNQLKIISSNIFKNNRKLEHINLDFNSQLIVPDYVFANLRNLKSIKMSNSELENVFEHTFEDCSNLMNLELQNNKFEQLPSGLLQTLKKLTTLNLGNNKLQFIPDTFFSNLENLEELNLEGNQFSIINNITFAQRSLKWLKVLNLSRNRIVHIHEDAFSILINLIKFDLSHNYWKGEKLVFADNVIEQISLSHNNYSYIDISTILRVFPHLNQLDYSHNNISHIKFSEPILLSTISNRFHNTIRVDIFDNTLICDCRNYEFFKYFKGTTDLDMTLKKIIDIRMNDTKCLDPKKSEYIPIEDISLQQLTCEDNHNCPAECTCSWRTYDETFVVDCSYRKLVIPPTLSIIRQRVEMILTGNLLTSGPTEDGGYENVTVLDLSSNKLISFDWCPPNIERVNLSHNNLKMLNPGVLNTLNSSSNFSQLTLEQNPLVCDCSALELQEFIQSHLQKVDSNDILCEDDQTALYKKKDLCKSKFLIALISTILIILLLISTGIACYWRYEREIKIWLYSKNLCLWIVSEEELDKDEKYDIFLSFSHKDEDFVIENLLHSLEKSFKLCIHSRDWVPGELINHQIVFSVYNSRRTVVVLSNDFLESAWGKLEFLMAHQRSMEEGRLRVIVIKLGDLNMDKMDDDFKAYMKTNTYVEWGDPWFWKKLMYSLPHSVIKNADSPSDAIHDFQYDGSLSQTRTTTLG